MGLSDVARTADNRRATSLLEQPGFRVVGHRARAVRPGERHRERDGLRAWLGEKGGHAALMQRLDRRSRRYASHARQQHLLGMRLEPLWRKVGVCLWKAADLPLKRAGLRHDIGGDAALSGSHLYGGGVRVRAIISRGLGRHYLDSIDFREQLCGD